MSETTIAWPADKVERWPIEKLIPYSRNARTHNDSQVAEIAASINEWGWTIPVLVDEQGVLIAGHGRVEAARKLNIPDIPVMVAKGWSEAKKKAYTIADNKLTLNAGWDKDLLKLEFAELTALDFDLSLAGFNEDELRALAFDSEAGAATSEEALPELEEQAISKLGDIWVLGKHRVICGDSTDVAAVKKLLGEEKPFIMVTDPPYGVEYDPSWRLNAGLHKEWQKRAEGKVKNDDRVDWTDAYKLFPGDVAYVWHQARYAADFAINLKQAEFAIRAQLIWSKPSLVIGRGHYHWQHEPCWYAVREGKKSKWCGDRKQSTIWSIPNMHRTQGDVDDGKTEHGTQKPVECMCRPIRNHGDKNDAVYDPFLGSGTTIIAAESLDRRCYGVELNPLYVDLICRRYFNLTGIKPRKENGEEFPV